MLTDLLPCGVYILEQHEIVPEKIDELGGHEGQFVYVVISILLTIACMFLAWKKRKDFVFREFEPASPIE